MNYLTAILAIGLSFASVSLSRCSDEVPKDDCSAAFYPVTACVRDGTRSVYIQFLECQPKGAHVTRAYFNWYRLLTRDGKTISNDDETLPVTWKELIIPKYFQRGGYVTVYYKKDVGEKETTMQIKIPDCRKLKSESMWNDSIYT